jgi:hypothetical protein
MTSEVQINVCGRVEIPRVKNFVEEVANSLKIDLSPTELTHVKWLAFTAWKIDNCEYEEYWQDNDLYYEDDREKVKCFIKFVTSSKADKEGIPKRFRDYHEFGIDVDSD